MLLARSALCTVCYHSAMTWEPVIGLEIHAQLATESKIFCGCAVRAGAPPNTLVCPVCLGLPGALPVLNARAVDFGILAALALGCAVQPVSVFARKNYFYPDLPKGYQISQFDRPLALDGSLEWADRGIMIRVGIVRVHLEEDAGKSLHDGFADSGEQSYVDFNRSGVPLVEIVTRPDFSSAADAAAFFARLRAILVEIGVSGGNLEEGHLRCDANVSLRRAGDAALGTPVEVKNLNSFRYLERALDHEIARQADALDRGARVERETRLWDVAAGRTVPMRSKELAHDYRYFPEPDLPPLSIEPGRVEAARRMLPELPEARRQRLASTYHLSDYDAGQMAASPAIARFFEATAAASGHPKAAVNWIGGEVARKLGDAGAGIEGSGVTPAALAGLIGAVEGGRISGSTAKSVLGQMWGTGRSADDVVRANGLTRMDDREALAAIVLQVMADHPKPVAQYKAGKRLTLGFLVGQVMRATNGQANPALVNELLLAELERT
jgi:aspartyl-tRNA(Asn)/glutamyl-tRNA(Gln) amidotransferase subunit B